MQDIEAKDNGKRPSGSMPGDSTFLESFDVVLGHAVKVIPGRVVGTNMIEAEPKIFIQLITAFGRAKFTGRRASGNVATAHPRLLES